MLMYSEKKRERERGSGKRERECGKIEWVRHVCSMAMTKRRALDTQV